MMNFPENLFYSVEHTWLRIEDKIGVIGISEFAQDELGEIVYVDLPNIGYNFKQEEIFGSIEALKTVSDLFMPISGKVVETNTQLLKTPTLVNTEPYSGGWIIKIEITEMAELKNLFQSEQYQQKINH